MKISIITFSFLILSSVVSFASSTIPVQVTEGKQIFQGNLFLPDGMHESLPLVVVVHEWWGKTDYPEMRAKRIADELGYAALAVDLFGNGKTVTNPKDADAIAGPFYKNPEMGVKRLQAFIAAAPASARQAQSSIDMGKVAAIGYCFGGAQALNLARVGKIGDQAKLLGVVSFHGSLASSMKVKGPIEPKLLVLHGAADKMVADKDVEAFKSEMKKANADLAFHAYPGASHAFTNPKATEVGKKFQIPVAYDAAADKDSWLKMKSFLAKLFGK